MNEGERVFGKEISLRRKKELKRGKLYEKVRVMVKESFEMKIYVEN
jgi:hypothetical protein